MVESERDSMRNCGSQGSRVPRPKEREHAHWFSQPVQEGGGGVRAWGGSQGRCVPRPKEREHAHWFSQPVHQRGGGEMAAVGRGRWVCQTGEAGVSSAHTSERTFK